MSNSLVHNKWHSFNHYTVSIEGYPDSATDPIASREFPFIGAFFNFINPLTFIVEDEGRSNSANWYFYYSLTHSNSADWEKYITTRNTLTTNQPSWDLGFNAYSFYFANSSKYSNVYTITNSTSSEALWNSSIYTGWQIALSSIALRTDRVGINTEQKVAVPVRLYENSNRIITWNLSAQTVYYNVTGNYVLSASNLINPKLGGKYTFWAYVDKCPESNANIVFDKKDYHILVNTPYNSFISSNNVITLSASSITRIDFVYNGEKMLGKATQYNIYPFTTDDLYFKGAGIGFTDPLNRNRNVSPVYIDSINPSTGRSFTSNPNADGIIIVSPYSSQFTETSSLYIPGPGIRMRFLQAQRQYISFILYNAQFPSESETTKYKALTSSFDRVIGYLSGGGDWKDKRYAENLFASPDSSTLTNLAISAAFPQPPYEFSADTIKTAIACTSTFTFDIFTGKDRDISQILINGVNSQIFPTVVNGMFQTYNFNNERTATYTITKIQSDFDLEIIFSPQTPILIPNNLLWLSPMNGVTLQTYSGNNRLQKLNSNTTRDFYSFVTPEGSTNAPSVITDRAVRFLSGFSDRRYSMLSTPLTTLSSSNSILFNGFTSFTVFRTNNNTFNSLSSIIWWMGDFISGGTNIGGIGLALSGNKLNTMGNFDTIELREKFRRDNVVRLLPNRTYVVCLGHNGLGSGLNLNLFVNNVRSSFQNRLFGTLVKPTNYNLTLGKNPNFGINTTNKNLIGLSDIEFLDFLLFDRTLTNSEISRMNSYLIEKYTGYVEV